MLLLGDGDVGLEVVVVVVVVVVFRTVLPSRRPSPPLTQTRNKGSTRGKQQRRTADKKNTTHAAPLT